MWVDADGTGVDRPRLDRDQFGLAPLHRLYETADGWLCLAVPDGDDQQVEAVASVLGLDALDPSRPEAAAATIAAALRGRPAGVRRDLLVAAGLLAEHADDTFV